MSDSTATVTPTPPAEGAKPEAPKPTPPASAPNEGASTGPVQLPDDHPLVKAYAAQKSEIAALKATADSGKSDAEKTAERLANVEKRAAEAEAKVLRRDIALEHKLSKDDAALLDNLTDEDAMKALAARLGAASGTSRTFVPNEGKNPQPGDDPKRSFLRGLTG